MYFDQFLKEACPPLDLEWRKYPRLKILNFEMEAGTLFKMGLVYGFAAGCVCAVLAKRLVAESVDLVVKQQAERNAVRVVLGALQSL